MPRKLGFSSVTDAELKYVAKRIRETLGHAAINRMASFGIDVETTLRMKALGELFVDARERRGLTLKDAAAHLRAPQYRVRDIETGSRRVDPGVLARYTAMLGISRGVQAWARRYPDLAAPVGLPGALRATAANRVRQAANPNGRRSAQQRNAAAGAPRRR